MSINVPDIETSQYVKELYKYAGSWRKAASMLNYYPAYANVLRLASMRKPGAISREAENELKRRLGVFANVEVQIVKLPPLKRSERVRRPRWSVPADSIEDLAEYLCKRLTPEEAERLSNAMSPEVAGNGR